MVIVHEAERSSGVDFGVIAERAEQQGFSNYESIYGKTGEVVALRLWVAGAYSHLEQELADLNVQYVDGTERLAHGEPMDLGHTHKRGDVPAAGITPETTPLLHSLREIAHPGSDGIKARIGLNQYHAKGNDYSSVNHTDKGSFNAVAFVVRKPGDGALGWTNVEGTEGKRDGTHVYSGPDEILVFDGQLPHGGGVGLEQKQGRLRKIGKFLSGGGSAPEVPRQITAESIAPHFYLPSESNS